tara:strand:- start:649 stop:828 length:180 start_codon:yes stop_codon:yes gene_type:complete
MDGLPSAIFSAAAKSSAWMMLPVKAVRSQAKVLVPLSDTFLAIAESAAIYLITSGPRPP